MMERTRLLLLGLLVLSAPATAEFYKWTDKDGNVHYGEKPPENTELQNIDTSTVNTMSAEESSRAARELNATMEDRRAYQQRQEQAKAKEARQKQQMQKRCKYMRNDLANLNRQMRIFHTNDQGERIYLDDEQRQKKIVELQKNVKQYCS